MANPFERRLLALQVRSTGIRYGTFPTSADGVAAAAITLTANAAAWTFGAWTQIVLAAGVTEDQQIVGIELQNYVMGGGVQGEIEIGTGVAPAGTMLGRFNIDNGFVDLSQAPIYVLSGVGIVARIRTSSAVADTLDAKVMTRTGF